MMYYPGKLANKSFRLYYYAILRDCDKKHLEECTRLIKINGCVTDYWEILQIYNKNYD